MANSAQARKRARQAEKRRQHNAARRSMMRTYVKKASSTIDAGDPEAARAAVVQAESMLDRAARKGLLHRNNAARQKSRLAAKLKAMSQ